MSLFKEGDKVSAIIFSEGAFRVGSGKCTSIKVVMENGQMAGVPWFEVYEGETMKSKWNGALLEGVEL